MYLYTGDAKYLTAARNVADVLASKARTGTATQSVWPYRVVMSTGNITSQYGANWIGAYTLLDALARAGIGNVAAYESARDKARAFILSYPMVTGYWTDGHTDNAINSNTYRSNLSKSNAALYILDNPEFDPNWRTHIPQLIQWTETYFVNRTVGGEPATDWGANIVGEQDSFNYKMDYQTARYAAENAKWYAASGDAASKEKAFRSLSWVTYTNDSNGRATESPYTTSIATWWSDCYGEGPRMFYHAFAAVPEWAPPGEDHILYSQGVLRNVSYAAGEVKYTPTEADDIEYLRLTFAPAAVTVGGVALSEVPDLSAEGYTVRSLGGGDYAVNVRRMRSGAVVVSSPADRAPRADGAHRHPGQRARLPHLDRERRARPGRLQPLPQHDEPGLDRWHPTERRHPAHRHELHGHRPRQRDALLLRRHRRGHLRQRVGAFRRGLRHPRGQRRSRPRLRRHQRLRDLRGGPRARRLRVHRRGLVQEDRPRRGRDDGRDPGDPERRPPRDQGPRRGGG